jgi:hypothetical protein
VHLGGTAAATDLNSPVDKLFAAINVFDIHCDPVDD